MKRLIAWSVFGGLLLTCAPPAHAALTVKAIAVGSGYGFALASDGTVWTWGQTPVQVNGISGVAAIAANYHQSLAVKNDGTVWAWDINGPTFFGEMFTPTAPAQVKGLSGVVAISAGDAHVLVLKNDGTVWAWGENGLGTLGNGTVISRRTPVQVSGLTGVIAIAAGQAHSLAVKSDGTVWAWGNNQWGQLGNGTTTAMGAATTLPVQVSGLTGAVAVAAGYGHSLALKSDGTLWAWGHNGGGQLGDGTKLNVRAIPLQVSAISGVAAMAATEFGTLAVKKDGTLWKWGQASSGNDQLTPLQVNGLTGIVAAAGSLALKSDGTVWAWGDPWGDGLPAIRVAPGRISGLSGVVSVSASPDGGLAMTSDGTVWEWQGQAAPSRVIGLSGVTAVAAGSSHSLALLGDGTVWEWSAATPAAPVSGLSGVTAIAAGDRLSLAVKRDGTVWTWGGPSAPVQVNGLSGVVSVAVAYESWWGEEATNSALRGLALKQDGTVWAWGGWDQDSAAIPAQVSELSGITSIAGGEVSLAVKGDGTVWEWDESGSDTWAPVQVEDLSGVKAVAVGARWSWFEEPHGLALKTDGTVWAWGRNSEGQLGDGTVVSRKTPVQVAGLSGVDSISAAGFRSLAATHDKTAWAWGNTGVGQARSAPVQVVQPGSPDLAIAIRHSGSFLVGDPVSYTVTISNTGLTATTGAVTVTDTLPPGLTHLSSEGSGWTCLVNGQVVTCTNPGPIDPGASSSIDVAARVEAQALPGVTNLATVANGSDRNPANNTIGDPTVVKPR